MIFTYARWLEPKWLDAHTVKINIQGLDPRLEGLTILHLSDLHQFRFGARQQKLLKAIGNENYDLVALTGDVLAYPNPYDFTPTAELLQGLEAPVFFVYGNHDYPGYEALARDLTAAGVNILANSWQEFSCQGATIQIAGVHDPHWTKNNPGSWLKTDFETAIQGTDPDTFTLLLSHSPGIIDWSTLAGVPLVLSGHTHGGQIKIPLLGAPLTASGKLFDQYVQGLYRVENTQLYINRGLGTTGFPLRFLSRPEVVFLQLNSGN